MKPDTMARHNESIRRVLKHVSANPANPHTIRQLSKVAHAAPHHFHRIFRRITGEPVRQYIRGLRLELSANRLLFTDFSVMQIALDAGYLSHEGFTRAFVKRFGLAPSQFRSVFEGDSNPDASKAIRARNEAFGKRGTAQRESVEVRSQGMLRAVFRSYFGPYEGIREAWFRLWDALSPSMLMINQAQAIGVVYDDPLCSDSRGIRYDACVVMPNERPLPDGLGAQLLPAITTICADHIGPYELTVYTYVHLINHWVSCGCRRRILRLPYYEVYRRPPFFQSAEEVDTQVHVRLGDVSCGAGEESHDEDE